MDCHQFIKHFSPSIPVPHFFSDVNCTGTVWKSPHGDFQWLTNSMMFKSTSSILPDDLGSQTIDSYIYSAGQQTTSDYNHINKIKSFIIPDHYTIIFTQSLFHKHHEIAWRVGTTKIHFASVIATKQLTLTGKSSFNSGDHPFFQMDWIKRTSVFRKMKTDGNTEDLPNNTLIEYHPMTVNQVDYSVYTDTNTTPPGFEIPYVWNIRTERLNAILTNINITQNYTEDQFKYDSCTQNKPWYIGDFPFTPTVTACEAYVTALCLASPNDVACTCLREELTINNSSLPVICFGPTCLDQGFVYRRMKDRDCNVSICQQLINVTGDSNIQITGTHHITCGHQVFTSKEIETIGKWTPTIETKIIDPHITITPAQEHGFCNWHIILLFVISFLMFMWIPIIVVYVRKQEQIRLMNGPESR